MARVIHIFDELVALIQSAPVGYAQWPRETLEQYLATHVRWRQLAWTRDPWTKEVNGLGVIMRQQRAQVESPAFREAPYRFYQPPDETDCVYVDLLIADHMATVKALIHEFQWRYADWRYVPLCAMRRGKLKWYKTKHFLAKLEHQRPKRHRVLRGFREILQAV